MLTKNPYFCECNLVVNQMLMDRTQEELLSLCTGDGEGEKVLTAVMGDTFAKRLGFIPHSNEKAIRGVKGVREKYKVYVNFGYCPLLRIAEYVSDKTFVEWVKLLHLERAYTDVAFNNDLIDVYDGTAYYGYIEDRISDEDIFYRSMGY